MEGNYREAQGFYAQSLQFADELYSNYSIQTQLNMDRDLLRADLADVLSAQGRLVEAEFQIRSVLNRWIKWATYGPEKLKVAYFMRQLAEILYQQGRYDDAVWTAQKSIALFESLCASEGSVFVASTKRLLAEALIARNQWKKALAVFESIQRDLGSREPVIFKQLFENNVDWAMALMKQSRFSQSLEKLNAALEGARSKGMKGEGESAEVQGLIGMAWSLQGEQEKALSAFQEAVPVLLEVAVRPRDRNRQRRTRQILEAYMAFLTDKDTDLPGKGRGTPALLFELSQDVCRLSTQEALSAGIVRNAVPERDLAGLIRKEQDIRHRIESVQRQALFLLSNLEGGNSEKQVERYQSTLKDLRAAARALSFEIEKRFPDYARVLYPKPVSIDAVIQALAPNEALVKLYPAAGRTYVWAISGRGGVSFHVDESLGRKEIGEAVASLRKALAPDPPPRTLGDIPDFDLARAYELYRKLLVPVAGEWAGQESLIVVASGPFGPLPFAVLPTSDKALPGTKGPWFQQYGSVPWLIREVSISRPISVSSFVALRKNSSQPTSAMPFAGFGDPLFNPQEAGSDHPGFRQAAAGGTHISVRGLRVTQKGMLDNPTINSVELEDLGRLPDTAEEIQTIAEALRADVERDVYLRDRATETQVKSMDLSTRRVIAFASHALIPGDVDGLDQPAIALTSPTVSGEREDGLLTMGEVLSLNLNADWVVLSACNTGSGEGRGAEAVTGLGRAFFYAGARSLLVSMWPVETVSAKRLTTTLFRFQAEDENLSRAEALRQSMLALMEDSSEQGYSYAHPIFWAPFVIVGD